MPAWASAPSSTALAFPKPARLYSNHDFDNRTGLPTRKGVFPRVHTMIYSTNAACSSLAGSEGLGFAELYFADIVAKSFQDLYSNGTLLEAWANAWVSLVTQFIKACSRLALVAAPGPLSLCGTLNVASQSGGARG